MAAKESAWNGNVAANQATQSPLAPESVTFVATALPLNNHDAIIVLNDTAEPASLNNIDKMILAFIRTYF